MEYQIPASMKILMVCLGNICRSPLAEGIFKKVLAEADLDWMVDSAGTGPWHVGERPDYRAVHLAAANEINITQQRARQIQRQDFHTFDYIFAMDNENLRELKIIRPLDSHRSSLCCIMEFAGMTETPDVPDPYCDDHVFQHVFDMLELAAPRVITRICEKKGLDIPRIFTNEHSFG